MNTRFKQPFGGEQSHNIACPPEALRLVLFDVPLLCLILSVLHFQHSSDQIRSARNVRAIQVLGHIGRLNCPICPNLAQVDFPLLTRSQ